MATDFRLMGLIGEGGKDPLIVRSLSNLITSSGNFTVTTGLANILMKSVTRRSQAATPGHENVTMSSGNITVSSVDANGKETWDVEAIGYK